jgi:bifunctional oligoribonuclease and PAP phosphatase NrnA
MYCAVSVPSYLKYVNGADRVVNELPPKTDLSIIVDTSASSLLKNIQKDRFFSQIKSKPCIVIDHHHQVDADIEYADLNINIEAAATGEALFYISKELDWPINLEASRSIAIAILSDTLGLTTESTTDQTVLVIAAMLKNGVKLSEIDTARKLFNKKSLELTHYKGELLKRIQTYADGKLAIVTIPWSETEKYSHQYNPPMLVLEDMKLVEGVEVAVVFKTYPDGKLTAKLRSNNSAPVCAKLAASFGGGGHNFASGFKIDDCNDAETTINEFIKEADRILSEEV